MMADRAGKPSGCLTCGGRKTVRVVNNLYVPDYDAPCPSCVGLPVTADGATIAALKELLTRTEAEAAQWQASCIKLEDRCAPAEAALREAWNELKCCDDISLDRSLAEGISQLQADRERLRETANSLKAALIGVLAVADRKTDDFDAARAAIAKATGKEGA